MLDVKWGRSVCGVLSHQIHVTVFLLYIHHGSTSPVYRNCHLHLTNTVRPQCCCWQGSLKESSEIELIWGAVLKTNDLPRAEWAGLLTMAEWLHPARNLTNRGVRTQILDWSDDIFNLIDLITDIGVLTVPHIWQIMTLFWINYTGCLFYMVLQKKSKCQLVSKFWHSCSKLLEHYHATTLCNNYHITERIHIPRRPCFYDYDDEHYDAADTNYWWAATICPSLFPTYNLEF